MMIDIKELRRLAEELDTNGHEQWSVISVKCALFMKRSADHIEQQEAEIARLHSSLAGAVQHGEQGWQRYESANRMCMNQQNEIAGLNAEIARLRKDAERYSVLRDRLLAADFEWGLDKVPVLVFSWPKEVGVGGNCDLNIDAVIKYQSSCPEIPDNSIPSNSTELD